MKLRKNINCASNNTNIDQNTLLINAQIKVSSECLYNLIDCLQNAYKMHIDFL